MKVKRMYVSLLIVLVGISTVVAGTRNEKFKVYGNCGMCKSTIEKAAKGVEGVVSADWNKETKMILVEFDDAKVNLMDIHKAIAGVGYDTDMVKAQESVYNELPSCCQYDRSDKENSGNGGNDH